MRAVSDNREDVREHSGIVGLVEAVPYNYYNYNYHYNYYYYYDHSPTSSMRAVSDNREDVLEHVGVVGLVEALQLLQQLQLSLLLLPL